MGRSEIVKRIFDAPLTPKRCKRHLGPQSPGQGALLLGQRERRGKARLSGIEIAGNFPAAHYVSAPVSVDGFRLPTRRRIYLRDADLMPLRDELMVSIDLSDFRFD